MTTRARRTAMMPNGTLMKKIHCQERKWVMRAPSPNPAARPRPLAEERYPRALPLISPGKVIARSAGPVAVIIAPPAPCRPRKRTSSRRLPETPHMTELAVNTANPAMKIFFCPQRSPSRPIAIRKLVMTGR
jgi:hypothetical protein